MKKSIQIIALTIALVLCTLTLFSCAGSTFDKIRANFEKNGYVLSEEDKIQTTITVDGAEVTVTIHTFKEKGEGLDAIIARSADVWEFESGEVLEKAIAENSSIQAILKDADQSKYVNGNCILMTYPIFNEDALAIFNGETIEK